jgi:hypothetical protein
VSKSIVTMTAVSFGMRKTRSADAIRSCGKRSPEEPPGAIGTSEAHFAKTMMRVALRRGSSRKRRLTAVLRWSRYGRSRRSRECRRSARQYRPPRAISSVLGLALPSCRRPTADGRFDPREADGYRGEKSDAPCKIDVGKPRRGKRAAQPSGSDHPTGSRRRCTAAVVAMIATIGLRSGQRAPSTPR